MYGIDPRLERSIGYTIIHELRQGKPFRRAGGGKFVHVDDVAAAVCAIVGNPDAAGRPYNLADCYARWSDWAAMAAGLMGIEADIDASSAPASKNSFSKDAARSLGVNLDRGHEGIRAHLRALIGAISGSPGAICRIASSSVFARSTMASARACANSSFARAGRRSRPARAAASSRSIASAARYLS